MATAEDIRVTVRHPLDPLTAAEIETATSILKRDRGLADTARFVYVTLREPAKEAVLNYQPGQTPDREAHIVLRERAERTSYEAVVSVTALSTTAMILYPLFATTIGLDHARAGVFLGGTIHDVAQVVGAGYTISPQTGDIATYVKLLRVTMLLPVVFTIAFVTRGAATAGAGPKPTLPLFLLGFAALVALNSLGFLAKPVTDAANEVSRWCLVTAIAALGMKTSFQALLAVGWRPVALMVLETAWIFGLVLTAVEIPH